jgi:hypothetical protein
VWYPGILGPKPKSLGAKIIFLGIPKSFGGQKNAWGHLVGNCSQKNKLIWAKAISKCVTSVKNFKFW